MRVSEQETWWQRAQAVLPGGVNSPVRSFRGVGGTPFFAERGEGAYLVDREGRRYIDYVMGYGSLILGHAHPRVVAAAADALSRGTGFGTPTTAEVELAETLVRAVPGLEMLRMVNSGTEATMTALRIARAATGKNRVMKFAGCYHGHHDSLLIRAGSGAATVGVPDSAGVPELLANLTIVAPYNDLAAVEVIFQHHPQEIAAVIVEPVAGNMGTVPPVPGFLEGLREITERYQALLVFDEVMTGFRVAYGGVGRHFGIVPDLITLAKVVGGGMPLGVYGGRRELLELVAPLGPVYQAGTFSGNPVATAVGRAQLAAIGGPDFYPPLAERTRHLAEGMVERGLRHGVRVSTHAVGGMFSLFFRERPPENFDEVNETDRELYRRFFHGMLERGIFLPPSPFETAFPSQAHGDAEIDATLRAADAVFADL